MAAKAASGAGTALVLTAAGAGFAYLSHLLFARWLGPAEYGSYIYSLTWARFMALLSGLGLTTAVLRFIPEYMEASDWSRLRGIAKRSRQLTFLSGIVIASLGTALIFALDPQKVDKTTLICGMWLVPLLGLTALQGEMLVGTQHIFFARFPNLVGQPLLALTIAFAIIAIAAPLNSLTALASYAFAAAIILGSQRIAFRHVLPSEFLNHPFRYSTPLWLRISLPLMLIQGFQLILLRSDIIIIGILIGDREAGIYNVAAQTATFVSFLFAAVNTAVAPMIASLHSTGDHASLQKLVRTSAKWMFWPSCAVTLALILWGRSILSLFGQDFTVGFHPLSLLAIAYVARSSVGPSNHLLSLTGHQDISAKIFGASALLNIGLNLALIPYWGSQGAALATLFTTLIWTVLVHHAVRKKLDIRSFILSPSRPTLST